MSTIASATVCKKNELIVLLQKPVRNSRTWKLAPFEVVRVDLATGRMVTTAAPEDVRYVLSDGQTIWWMPQLDGIAGSPFVLDGRPVAMTAVLMRFPLSQGNITRINNSPRATGTGEMPCGRRATYNRSWNSSMGIGRKPKVLLSCRHSGPRIQS